MGGTTDGGGVLVVRRTFLDVMDDDETALPLFRTASDPTGYRLPAVTFVPPLAELKEEKAHKEVEEEQKAMGADNREAEKVKETGKEIIEKKLQEQDERAGKRLHVFSKAKAGPKKIGNASNSYNQQQWFHWSQPPLGASQPQSPLPVAGMDLQHTSTRGSSGPDSGMFAQQRQGGPHPKPHPQIPQSYPHPHPDGKTQNQGAGVGSGYPVLLVACLNNYQDGVGAPVATAAPGKYAGAAAMAAPPTLADAPRGNGAAVQPYAPVLPVAQQMVGAPVYVPPDTRLIGSVLPGGKVVTPPSSSYYSTDNSSPFRPFTWNASEAVVRGAAARAIGSIAQAIGAQEVHPRFHSEVNRMGDVSQDYRSFRKGTTYSGRLSTISEDEIRYSGKHRYLVSFTGDELSIADGMGFIFNSPLPCPKNIQKLVSIFLNQKGVVCVRIHHEVLKLQKRTKMLEIGDWLEMVLDLDDKILTFQVWPGDGSTEEAWAPVDVHFEEALLSLKTRNGENSWCAFMAGVLKNAGTGFRLL